MAMVRVAEHLGERPYDDALPDALGPKDAEVADGVAVDETC